MSSLKLQALDSNLLLLFINVIVRESEKYLEATFAHLDQDERGQQPPPHATPRHEKWGLTFLRVSSPNKASCAIALKTF